MELTITLSPAEVDALDSRRVEQETLADVVHRAIVPFVNTDSKRRLDRLVDQYRTLTPDDQVEVLGVLRTWRETKQPPLVEESPIRTP